jgi:septal ring factor EnvC (AmiA/AmiB activator)
MMDESERSEDDEIIEIRRAMKEAKTRKKILYEKSKNQFQQTQSEKTEMEEIVRKMRYEIEQLKKKSSELDFDLKESRYEASQLHTKYSQLENDKNHQEGVYKAQISDLQSKIESIIHKDDDRFYCIAVDTEKLSKLFETLGRSSEITSSQTSQHILLKTRDLLTKVKEIANVKNFDSFEYRKKMSLSSSDSGYNNSQVYFDLLCCICFNLFLAGDGRFSC